VPIVSVFFGIIIRMYFDDHPPPHFHAEYQGSAAIFDFSGRLIAGAMRSATARRLIREWARAHAAELEANWARATKLQPLGNELHLQVRDDGPGLPPDAKRGVGLSNTAARLQQLYGDHQKLELLPAEGGGVLVSISIPFRVAIA
jgi:hypothetical protein